MTRLKQILTITLNPTIDMSSSVENVFPEHKLRCGSAFYEPGGGGLNVARAIHQLGGNARALHFCGGPTGDILRALLDKAAVEQEAVTIEGWTRESVTILETATGQQYRFVMPGPTFTEAEWRGALERIAKMEAMPELVVASGSLPPGVPDDFYAQLARIVRERGSRFILDTSGPALSAAVRAGVFLIKPSLRELRDLCGKRFGRGSRTGEGGGGDCRKRRSRSRCRLVRRGGRVGRFAGRLRTSAFTYGAGAQQSGRGRQHGCRHRLRVGARLFVA